MLLLPLDRLRKSRVFIGTVTTLAACSGSPASPDAAADAAATVAQVAAAVTGQKAALADEHQQGSYVGFDTHQYPGDKTMEKWRHTANSPYRWVGFYLPSPCHRDDSWSGKRETLQQQQWGLAVVYVGQQTWGRKPRMLSAMRLIALRKSGKTCNADYLSADQGRREADDAISRARNEGFAKGSVIFLDIERMEKVPQPMRDYYSAWVKRLIEEGSYRPGIYTHKWNAEMIYGDVKALYLTAGVSEEPRFWIASARDFDPGKAPTDVGQHFAGMWQGAIDVMRSVADVRLPIDVNVSAWPSPSDFIADE